jgi:hypothetical protein
MVISMEQKEKQEFVLVIRAEMRRALSPLEDRLNASIRKSGVLWENINDKFKLVTERFDTIDKTLDKHTEMFKDIYQKLDKKADVEEFDALEPRVVKLEGKTVRPSRSG